MARDSILFNTEFHDYGSNYATGTGVFTAPEAGAYALSSTLNVDPADARSVSFTMTASTAGTLSVINLFDEMNSTSVDDRRRFSLGTESAELAKGETVSVTVTFTTNAPVVRLNESFFSGRKIS